MLHLSPERIAALADETPTPAEAAHLGVCGNCTAELAAQRKVLRLAAGAQPIVGAPLTDFSALLPRLRAEGIAAPRDGVAVARRWTVRVAASLVLVLGGAVVGRVTVPTPLPVLPMPTAGATQVTSASVNEASSFKSSDDAMQALTVSQRTYENAAAFLAAQDTTAHFIGLNENTYRKRLEALDQMAAITRAALYQAPQDPVLNQAVLATQSARLATLRQINLTTTSSKRMVSR